jgi:Ni2+-binding GTPase involved in maturation of urease and hydrogenase
LLHGPPGTGKTSLIMAIANALEFNIYDLELTTVQIQHRGAEQWSRRRGGVCGWEQVVRHLTVERAAPRAERSTGDAIAVVFAVGSR